MEEFWIQLLAILTLLTQTSTPSDTPELIGGVGGAVTFRNPDTGGNAALWSVGSEPIVTVAFEDPSRPLFLKEEFKTHFAISESGRALSIPQLTINDAGTYSVNIHGKISTFILLIDRKLAEPRVTCKAQECSGSGSGIGIGAGIGIGIVIGIGVAALLFRVFFSKSKGYWTAHAARLGSGSGEVPDTAGPGHWSYLRATSRLGPVSGLAMDQHGPETGVAMDQHGPSPGLATDQDRPEPGPATDQSQE